MNKNSFIKLSLALGLALANTLVFADTHYCIGLNNQSDKPITYSQFPDDIGIFSVSPKKQYIFHDELSHADSYEVTLDDNAGNFTGIKVKPGSMIVYLGKSHHPEYVIIYPGCE